MGYLSAPANSKLNKKVELMGVFKGHVDSFYTEVSALYPNNNKYLFSFNFTLSQKHCKIHFLLISLGMSVIL